MLTPVWCQPSRDTMENVYTTVLPFYYSLKTFGGFPMSFQGSARKVILKRKIYDVFATGFWSLTLLLVFAINLTQSDSISSTSAILLKAWDFSLVVCLFTVLISFCYQIHKRESIAKFLALVNDFDRMVKFSIFI